MRFVRVLDDIVQYEPGLTLELVMRRYGLDEVVKLASNEFPMPPFASVKRAIADALGDLNRYPDGHTTDLRAALAKHYSRAAEQIIVGNGACEILMLLGDVLLAPGDEAVFATPSFSLYEKVCVRHEAVPVAVPLADLRHDLEAMAAAVTPRTKMVFLCNPNNPTGTYLAAAEVAAFVESLPGDVLVVLDEAYNEFVTEPDAQDCLAIQAAHDNVVVLRTFSKIYGLCGLRVGYGIGAPELRAAVDKVRQPFNVNRLAQIAAVEALAHQDEVAERRAVNAGLRAAMERRLAARGRRTVPSQANFMLVDARGLRHPQEEIFEALLSAGVIVRDGNALGIPGWLRVSVGTDQEIEFFLHKLAALEVAAQVEGPGRSS